MDNKSNLFQKVAIVGGGAAGFFSAIEVKRNYPLAQVTIFEKSSRVLQKVLISGGGRCNLTNGCSNPHQFAKAYPRGERVLKRLFMEFGATQTMEWFSSRGVPLVVQDDNCVFPLSQNSASITNLLEKEAKKASIKVVTKAMVTAIKRQNTGLQLAYTTTKGAPTINEEFQNIIVTTGGSQKPEEFEWLKNLGHKIEKPIPSLFTFNIPDNSLRELQGVVEEGVTVSIEGTKLKAEGELLITHWGMSGPAILKLSSYGAKVIHQKGYRFLLLVNWSGKGNHNTVSQYLKILAKENSSKLITTARPSFISKRLWYYLLEKRGFINRAERETLIIERDTLLKKGVNTIRWGEIGSKGINRLTEILVNDSYFVDGKSNYREEFVTCGGISLSSIDSYTLESKVTPGLYFAGEVLDIDAITGGFNLQAAWTTAHFAAKLKKSN